MPEQPGRSYLSVLRLKQEKKRKSVAHAGNLFLSLLGTYNARTDKKTSERRAWDLIPVVAYYATLLCNNRYEPGISYLLLGQSEARRVDNKKERSIV